MSTEFSELLKLGRAERLQLVEDLWDSIAVETPAPDLPLTPALAAELDGRVRDLDDGRERVFNWEEVRDRILKDKLHGP